MKRTKFTRSKKKTFGRARIAGVRSSRGLGSLKKKAWQAFSRYVRARDNYTCFTCGARGEGKGLHAGHFIPKSLGLALYFDEGNVFAQCYHCNINLGGYGAEFARRIHARFGEAELTRLYALKGTIKKYAKEDYQGMIDLYTKKLSDII